MEGNKVSYSQYTMWANCPQAWKLKYVDGHRLDEGSIHTVFGSVIHEVIQDWLHILFNESVTVARSMDLDDTFREKFMEHFKTNTTVDEDGVKTFPSDKQTLMEFFGQGQLILSYVQKHHEVLFPTENTTLVGIEYPIDVEVRPGVRYVGYVDILTKNEETGLYTIYDLKTSKSGWNNYQKNDKTKISQLLLYKKFIAEHFGVALPLVRVEYLILKRIISENSPFPIPRVTQFEPSNGKPSVNKAWEDFTAFLDDCFDETGQYKTDTIQHKAGSSACRFCVYKNRKDLCEYGV